jgi:hypothetical protein
MSGIVSADVFINEFLSDTDPATGEWIELYNNGSSSVNLANWNISDESNKNLTLDITIAANGFVILSRNFAVLNQTYPGINNTGIVIGYNTFELNNDGDSLFLYNSSSDKVDNISYSTALGDNVSKGRYPDGSASITTFSVLTPGDKNDNAPPAFNKWITPSANNSFIRGLFNVTVNITDIAYSVNTALINFNNTNYSMSQNNDLWYYLWNTSKNLDGEYNITIFFNDTVGLSNTDTLFNITVDNINPKIQNGSTSKNVRDFIAKGTAFTATVNATDAHLQNVTCTLNGVETQYDSVSNDIYTCNLNAPNEENDFIITFTAIDEANNENTTTTTFTTKYTTAASLVPENITITDLTNEDKLVNITATLSNTGSNTLYDPGVKLENLDSTFPGSIVTSYTACSVSSLASGESCSVNLTINVRGRNTGTYNAFWNANWTESSFTTIEFTQDKTSEITLASNPVIDVAESVSETISHGAEKNITFQINSSGNVDLSNVAVTFVAGNLTASQVTFISPSTFTTITSDNETMNITLTVPTATSPGTYEGTLSVSADSATTKTTNVSVTVPQDTTWTSSPSNITVYKKITDSGTAATITITNEGNVDMNFSLSYEGSLFKKLMLPPVVIVNDLFVNKNSVETFNIDYNAGGPFTEYDLNLTITNQLTSETNKTTLKLIHDNNNPTIDITNPLDNSFVNDTVLFTVSATDLNLSRVEYYINNDLVLNSGEINFTFKWDTTNGSYSDAVYTLKAIAYDSAGNSNTSDLITVIVNNTDSTPLVANPLTDFSFDEDTINDSINLSNVFASIDNEALTYTHFINDTNISVSINQTTGIATLTPEDNWTGSAFIIFNASDSAENYVTDGVIVTVDNINDAPTTPNLISPTNNTIVKSASGIVILKWNDSIDVDDTTTKYFIFFSNNSNNLILNSTVTVDATAEILVATTLELSGLQNDTYFWNVIAGDGNLNSSPSETFQFSMNLDTKPQIISWRWNTSTESSSNFTNITIAENVSIEFQANVTDIDGDKIKYEWSLCTGDYDNLVCTLLKDNGFNSVPITTNLTYTPEFDDSGTKTIRLEATDNNSNSIKQDWNLTITNTNREPVLDSISNKEVAEDSTLTFNITAFDPDNDSLTFTSNVSSISFTNAAFMDADK